MFGLGIWELAVILVVALLVLGPEKLPKVARQLGRVTRELRRAVSEFQSSLTQADVDEPSTPPPAAPSIEAPKEPPK
jgi:Tat protein translocase TatB subunit